MALRWDQDGPDSRLALAPRRLGPAAALRALLGRAQAEYRCVVSDEDGTSRSRRDFDTQAGRRNMRFPFARNQEELGLQ